MYALYTYKNKHLYRVDYRETKQEIDAIKNHYLSMDEWYPTGQIYVVKIDDDYDKRLKSYLI